MLSALSGSTSSAVQINFINPEKPIYFSSINLHHKNPKPYSSPSSATSTHLRTTLDIFSCKP